MARRPPWWRVIDWRVVVVVGLPAWYAAGAVVVAHQATPSARAVGRPAPPPSEPPPPPPAAEPDPEPTPPGAVGPFAWFAVTAAAVDPRVWPGVPFSPLPGPFVARLIDGGGPADPEPPDHVWQRARGRGSAVGPPAVLDECRTHGTYVGWRSSPDAAFHRAAAEDRLAFVLHVSGADDDEWFAGNHPRAFWSRVLRDPQVGREFRAYFVPALQKVVRVRSLAGPKPDGDVVGYFCTPEGRVVHAVPGPVTAEAFHREAFWAVQLYRAARAAGGEEEARRVVRAAHLDRLRRFYGPTVPIDLLPRLAPPPPPSGGVFRHPALTQLPDIGTMHALLGAHPLPRLGELYPVVWERPVR